MADFDNDPEFRAILASAGKRTAKLGAKRAEEERQRRLAIGTTFDRLIEELDEQSTLNWFRALEEVAASRDLARIQTHPRRPASLPKAEPAGRGRTSLASDASGMQ